MSMDLNANGPKNVKGTGDGSPGGPLEQEVHDLLVEAGVGGVADAAWSGTGNSSVIAALKKIALRLGASTVMAESATTITLGGTAQALFSGATPVTGYLIQNNSAGPLWFSDLATAVAGAPSIQIPPNGSMWITPAGYTPPGPVSLIGATTGQAFTARRY